MRICYSEPSDQDFIRWTSNLLDSFLADGSIEIVRQSEKPDLMLASVWRPHPFPAGVPVLLVSCESWRRFPGYSPLARYHAVIGPYPPAQPCNFIQYPIAAVYLHPPIKELYAQRPSLLALPKTKFCCFVVSDTVGNLSDKRIALFRSVNAWRHVDAAGRVENNTQYRAPKGLEYLPWIAQYKYMICVENAYEPGYITEKPFQSWFSGTVPIYAGGAADTLNPGAFINAATQNVLEELQRQEEDSSAYETMRHTALTSSPLSLLEFEQLFRAKILSSA